jgi:hypothetical protein
MCDKTVTLIMLGADRKLCGGGLSKLKVRA